MKHIIFILAFFIFSLSMNAQINTEACKLELTKSEVIINPFHKTCFKDLDLNEIKAFKIKFIGKPSQYVEGHKLNNKTKVYLSQARIGDYIQIFDIEYKNSESSLPKNVTIKLIS